ncbi:MAG: LLM class flavin-dependent oxidoreductase [Ktedonobacterales bacterium]|nr:LLM class flavin-dependent oxidoreductase [Ktedonobacterales bacterium]
MRYGFILPGGGIRELVALAAEAEAAGWDGVFVPDCIAIESALDPLAPAFDPWVLLGAIAMRTERVVLGTMVTPLSRRRPWKVARETVTLDHLANGRTVLPVGLGALDDGGFGKVGEATDRKVRAQLLDEALAILDGLWSGQPFRYDGEQYHLEEMTFLPPPVRSPRIPVWVVAAWPRVRSLRRALRWDGVIPGKLSADGAHEAMTPTDIQALVAFAAERRSQPTPLDIIFEGETPGDDPARAADIVRPYAEAGVTWWLESLWAPRRQRAEAAGISDPLRTRILQGPPRAASPSGTAH